MRNFPKILVAVSLLVTAGCKQKTLHLEITSNHEKASVFVNDEIIGNTPIKISMYPGIMNIAVRKTGYEDFVYCDTILKDSVLHIHALLLTKEEMEKIEAKKRKEEEIRQQKEKEEQSFASDISGVFTDFRDMKKYRWVKIGSQIWMAENLAYEMDPESGRYWAYGNNPSHVKSYGYLYNWESAQPACPAGWHIPTAQEWQEMVSYLGDERSASEKLRERGYTHWADGYYYRPMATNESKFTARPGGQRNDNGEFITVGTYAFWWSASTVSETEGLCYWLGYMGDYLNKEVRKKTFGLSVRCVKD